MESAIIVSASAASASFSLNIAFNCLSFRSIMWYILFIVFNIFFLLHLLAGKEIAPRTVNDVTIINAGQVLENNRTLAESRNLAAESPEGPITMHVVVRRSRPERRGTMFFLLFVIVIFQMFVDDIRVSQIEIITVCPSFSYPDIRSSYCRTPKAIGEFICMLYVYTFSYTAHVG